MGKGGWTVMALVGCLLLAGCLSRPAPIRIGLAINLSGRGGTPGEYIRDGALLAVEELNRNGGVHGRPLQLLIEDDRNSREGILAADQRLIEAGVVAIIGHSYSENTLLAYPYVTSRQTLLFTPYTATTKLSDRDDLFCRTSVDNRLYGRALATLLQRWRLNRVAFLMDISNPSFVEDYLAQTRRYFHGRIVAVRFDSRRRPDWSSLVKRLMAGRPQVVVMLTEASMTGIGAQKLRQSGFQGELVATLWAQSPELWRYGGRAVEGMAILTFIPPASDRPAFKAFAARMRARFGRPPTAKAARAYEAIFILARALARCQEPLTAAKLKAALLAKPFATLLGTVRFNRFCDVVRPVYELRVRERGFFAVGSLPMPGPSGDAP